jgi:hypothetical protein
MVVLAKYIHQYKNGKEDNDSDKAGDDDDDIIIKNESDSEEEKSGDKEKVFFENLAAHIDPLNTLFRFEPHIDQPSPLNG